MKEIILSIVLLAAMSVFAQSDEVQPELRLSGTLLSRIDDGITIGVSLEYPNKKKGLFGYESTLLYGGTSVMSTAVGTQTSYGTGFVVGFGSKFFLSNKKRTYGWNIQSMTEYVQYNFSDKFYTGTYKYISLVNPLVGYKFKHGNFVIEPSIGFTWKNEIKGQGDVDNKKFNNTIMKFALNAGYLF